MWGLETFVIISGSKRKWTVSSRFSCTFQPKSMCEGSIQTLVGVIKRDTWPVAQGHRPLRATGAALSLATSLLEVFICNHACINISGVLS